LSLSAAVRSAYHAAYTAILPGDFATCDAVGSFMRGVGPLGHLQEDLGYFHPQDNDFQAAWVNPDPLFQWGEFRIGGDCYGAPNAFFCHLLERYSQGMRRYPQYNTHGRCASVNDPDPSLRMLPEDYHKPIDYSLALRATGCCNYDPPGGQTSYWASQSDDAAFNDMYAYCQLVKDGTGNAGYTEICGCGDSPPTSCVLQNKYTYNFIATGCCNRNADTSYWEGLDDDNAAYNDMYTFCTLVKSGTATANQIDYCGCGDSPPTHCIQQRQVEP